MKNKEYLLYCTIIHQLKHFLCLSKQQQKSEVKNLM
jgi:hypothetical protein